MGHGAPHGQGTAVPAAVGTETYGVCYMGKMVFSVSMPALLNGVSRRHGGGCGSRE